MQILNSNFLFLKIRCFLNDLIHFFAIPTLMPKILMIFRKPKQEQAEAAGYHNFIANATTFYSRF